MTIQIVEFSDDHAAGVVEVILPIQQVEFSIPITLEAQPDLLDIPGTYQRGKGNFWVALAAGTVVGTIGLLDIGNCEVALRKMFVKSAYRGPQYRVSKELLDKVVDWCQLRGIQRIYLGTTAKFEAAHRFYEKHGFGEISAAELPKSFPIMVVDSRFYALTLPR